MLKKLLTKKNRNYLQFSLWIPWEKNIIHHIGCASCKQRFLFPYKINQSRRNISLQVESHVQIDYKSNKSM